MSQPTDLAQQALKGLERYLKKHPRLVFGFPKQQTDKLEADSDTDWAGCAQTAKSTGGGIICFGENTIKSYRKQQKVVALSSAEAGLYAMVAASAESMAIQTCCRPGARAHERVMYR